MLCTVFLPLALVAFIIIQARFHTLLRFSPATITDLIAVVRRVDEAELRDLLDEKKQENLRVGMYGNRWIDRARLLHEYLGRMGFNVLMILHWSYAEQEQQFRPGLERDSEKENTLKALVARGLEFRMYVMFARVKLAWWIVRDTFGVPPARKLASMRQIGQTDGLHVYRRLADDVYSFALEYGTDVHNRLLIALWGGHGI